MAEGKINPAGGSGEKEGRDSACTPKWLADLIGKVDMDVATNDRAHIQASIKLVYDRGDDGLYGHDLGDYGHYKIRHPDGHNTEHTVGLTWKVFCNPPYARGQVIKWVKHWRSTRFIFLLRWDPSTEWFAELIPHCTHVWFPGKRINFEPPPGVKFSSNPFPHALYLRDPDQALLDRLSESGYLFPVDQQLLDFYVAGDNSDDDERVHGTDSLGEQGEAAEGAAREGGGDARKEVGEVRGIAAWIPAAEPKQGISDQLLADILALEPAVQYTKPKYGSLDLKNIKKAEPVDYGYARTKYDRIEEVNKEFEQRREQKRERIERQKRQGLCGDCLDCEMDFGWCVWKTEQYLRNF